MLPISTADSSQHIARPVPRSSYEAFEDRTLDMPLGAPAVAPSTIDLPRAAESQKPIPSPVADQATAGLVVRDGPEVESECLPETTAGPGIGSVLRGRFQLTRPIGTGGFSLIFEATDLYRLSAGSPVPFVAIKVLKPEFRLAPEAIERLKREFARLESLSHPHIGHAFDLDRDGETWFLVLELLDGQPLSMMLNRQPQRSLARQEALQILRASGEALEFAHQRGVLHCDFKPGNILISQTDEVRVIDFGSGFDQYARSSPETEGVEVRRQATPAYASPEALAGEPPDVRDDVYSFAAVAHELLTGKRYQAGNTEPESSAPRARPRGIGRRQWHLLMQCLSPVRASRPASLRSVLEGFKPRKPFSREWLVACAVGVVTGLLLKPGAPEVPVPQTQAEESVPAQPQVTPAVAPLPGSSVDSFLPTAAGAGDAAMESLEPQSAEPAPSRSAATAEPTWVSLDQRELKVFRPTTMAAMIVLRNSGPQRAVRIRWRTVAGTALPGIDYVPVDDGVVQFADNQNLSSLYVPLVNRDTVAVERTFYIEIVSASPQVSVGPVTRVAVTISG